MSIVAECGQCGRKFKASPSSAGKRAKCPDCGATIDIPRDVVATPAPSAPPASYQLDSDHDMPAIHLGDHDGTASDRNRQPSPVPRPKWWASPMPTWQGHAIIALMIVGFAAPYWSAVRPIPKWEYQMISPSDEAFDSELKRMGDEGWELVNARRAANTVRGAAYELIFKRPK